MNKQIKVCPLCKGAPKTSTVCIVEKAIYCNTLGCPLYWKSFLLTDWNTFCDLIENGQQYEKLLTETRKAQIGVSVDKYNEMKEERDEAMKLLKHWVGVLGGVEKYTGPIACQTQKILEK